MTITRHLAFTLAVIFCALLSTAQAQTPVIEVTTDSDRAQFITKGETQQMRVEVFSPSGELVFEGDALNGQPVEWEMQDGRGVRVSDGVYLATVTVTDYSGKRRKRIEQITVSRGTQEKQAVTAAVTTDNAVAPISGEGTTGKIAKFTDTNTIGDSVITESGKNVAVNFNTPVATLQVHAPMLPSLPGDGTSAATLLQTSGGKGGNTTGADAGIQTAGAGASILLVAGNGGNAPAGNTRGNGGNITLQPGGVGGGAGTGGTNGNVLIAPTAVGNVGVGTNAPTAKLTVAGGNIQIMTAGRGVKFSDSTIQTTAALPAVQHNTTLSGAGTSGSPLSLAPLGVGTGELANGAVTGAKIAVPLTLSGSNANAILSVANAGSGAAITATGDINTSTQYNIGGNRVVSIPGDQNTFVGILAGASNTAGNSNAFFGRSAGSSNTTGTANAFFGAYAGPNNTSGSRNAFFGASAGVVNTTGSLNSFFGEASGYNNETGLSNSFFGAFAGFNNTEGNVNAFFGVNAGYRNKTGVQNAFFGTSAGHNNTTGQSDAFFGYVAGYNNTTGNANAFFGDSAGQSNNEGNGNAFFGASAGPNNTSGSGNTFLGLAAGESNTTEDNNTFIGSHANGATGITNATAIGANASVTQSDSLVLGTTNARVGIGTSAPKAKLHVAGGKIYVEASGQGIILKSPNGTCYELTVANGGALGTAMITCPM